MNKDKQLSLAIEIAAHHHSGQYDKGGNPYILHPIHIMNELLFDKQLATIAVLHDVVEDTSMTIEALSSAGFSLRVINAIKCLTHVEDQSYDAYIEVICGNYDAIRVKRKDLEHNSNITRLKGITEKDLLRTEKYYKAFVLLSEAKRTFER